MSDVNIAACLYGGPSSKGPDINCNHLKQKGSNKYKCKKGNKIVDGFDAMFVCRDKETI